jgi:type III secretion protein J
LDTGFAGFRSQHRARGGIQVLLAAVILCALGLASCKSDLITDLDQRQANDIVALLLQNGIPAERIAAKGDRITVSVDDSRFAEAVAVLHDHGLPRKAAVSLCEVFKKDSLVSSPMQERALMTCALSQELARTVREFDGVLSAEVHLVLPESDPLRQQLVTSSAAVFIQHRATIRMDNLVPQVKMLVANAVAGLNYDKVSVILNAVPERAPIVRNDMRAWARRDGLSVADWPIYSLAALAAALVAAVVFMLRRRQRTFQLDADDVVKKS